MRTKLNTVKIISTCLFLTLCSLNSLAETSALNNFKIIPQKELSSVNPILSRTETFNFQNALPGLKPKLILDNKQQFQNLLKSHPQGPKTGGGGNSCALAIVQSTRKILESNDILKKLIPESQIILLQQSIASAKFYISQNLELNGQLKDAINYPNEKTILVSEHFCKQDLNEVSNRTISLVLHEYLGLASIDDSQYQISEKYLDFINLKKNSDLYLSNTLENQADLDLNGKPSCFNGSLRKHRDALSKKYGWFATKYVVNTPEVYEISASQYLKNYIINFNFAISDKSGVRTEGLVYAIQHLTNKTGQSKFYCQLLPQIDFQLKAEVFPNDPNDDDPKSFGSRARPGQSL